MFLCPMHQGSLRQKTAIVQSRLLLLQKIAHTGQPLGLGGIIGQVVYVIRVGLAIEQLLDRLGPEKGPGDRIRLSGLVVAIPRLSSTALSKDTPEIARSDGTARNCGYTDNGHPAVPAAYRGFRPFADEP